MVKYWISIYAPFHELPLPKSTRIAWLLIGTVVEVDEDMSDPEWAHVRVNGRQGWILWPYLEEYQENYETNPFVIENQTPEKNDFEQFVFTNGVKQTNYCGQLCLAYILDVNFDEVLQRWKEQKPSLWKSIFSSPKARGTGYGELQEILKTFNVESTPMTAMLYEPIVKRSLYTPERLQRLTESGYPLVGVKIDSLTGRLRGQGIGHWVVVTGVQTERTGYGFVEIYNPAPHRTEIYSWAEFIASAGTSPTGLYVSK